MTQRSSPSSTETVGTNEGEMEQEPLLSPGRSWGMIASREKLSYLREVACLLETLEKRNAVDLRSDVVDASSPRTYQALVYPCMAFAGHEEVPTALDDAAALGLRFCRTCNKMQTLRFFHSDCERPFPKALKSTR